MSVKVKALAIPHCAEIDGVYAITLGRDDLSGYYRSERLQMRDHGFYNDLLVVAHFATNPN
jgi:hypothetical protein